MPSLLSRLLKRDTPPPGSQPYEAIVDWARTPGFYRDHGVPDTIDGRFDMICLGLALVLIRLERDGVPTTATRSALLERFVDDMDRNARELGVGDLSVGKEIKAMLSGLTGRMDAYRAATEARDATALQAALVRNVWRSRDAGDAVALAQSVQQVADWLGAQDTASVAQGALAGAPRP